MSEESYKYREIEPKWREYWISNRLHEARDDDPRPKYYCLDMFPPHRVQHLVALKPFVSGPAIRQNVTAPMPYMQPRSRRVCNNIQAVVFGPRMIIPRLVKPVRDPVFTPLRLDLSILVTFIRHDPMIIAYRCRAL